MKKLLLVLILATLVVGCISQEDERMLQEFVGAKACQIVTLYGYPEEGRREPRAVSKMLFCQNRILYPPAPLILAREYVRGEHAEWDKFLKLPPSIKD